MADDLDDEEERYPEQSTDEAVRATRRDILERRLGELLPTVFGPRTVRTSTWRDGAWQVTDVDVAPRSCLLCVAQYWNDQASDECHVWLVLSSRDVPDWPHTHVDVGTPRPDVCRSCCNLPIDTYDWGYLDLIPAFEAYCHEGADQNDDWNDSYRPFVAARLVDGKLALDQVGPIVRPWLDLPRTPAPQLPVDDRLLDLIAAGRETGSFAALGDALVEREDPRGLLIAHAAVEDAAEPGLARSWLRSFEPHVPRTCFELAGGVPSEIGLWLDADREREFPIDLDDPLPWAFGPRVRFLSTSRRAIWAQLAHCRALGPLGAYELLALAELDVPFAAEEVELDDDVAYFLDMRPPLPRLRVLRVIGATPALVDRFSQLPPLAHLEVAAAYDTAEAHAADVAAWRAANLAIPVTVAMVDAPTRRAAGWAVTIAPDRTTVTRIGYTRLADDAWRETLVAGLPGIEKVASRFWSPPDRK